MDSIRPFHLVSHHMHGQNVKDAQYLLTYNRFKQNFHPGPIDGDWGELAAAGTKRAKYWLGYQKKSIDRVYGDQLHAYLLGPARKGSRLTPMMLARRAARLRAAKSSNASVKVKALNIGLREASLHVVESPMFSNHVKYGEWYGLDRNPWCAMFVTWCFVMAGDKKIFSRGSRTAYAYWPEYAARSGHPLLHITSSPEPGDIVVYHHRQGHIGIFRGWTNHSAGEFEAVEGNTSTGGSQDNGGAVLVRRRTTSWVPTVFVKVGE